MKNKFIVFAFIAFAGVNTMQAQEQVKPTQDPAVQQQRATEKRSAEVNDKTVRELGLNEAQAKELQNLEKDYTDGMEALRASGDQDRIQQEGAMLSKRREARLQQVLTSEQYEKLKSQQDL